jgi:hypothetical protein
MNYLLRIRTISLLGLEKSSAKVHFSKQVDRNKTLQLQLDPSEKVFTCRVRINDE